MTAFVCYCGQAADELHHPTARMAGEGSSYLDPDFRIPACHDDHALIYDDQRRMAELERDVSGAEATILDRLEVRLRRSAAFAGRVAEAISFSAIVAVVLGFATYLERWANELDLAIRILDSLQPGWRTLPGMHG